MTAKETRDAGKQDNDANVNRAKAGKYSNRNADALAVKLMEKPKRNPEVEKKTVSGPGGEMWATTRAKEMPGYWENMANALRRILSHVPVQAIKI